MREGSVAVTGSTGLLGRALVDRLRAAGTPVVRLVRRAPRGPGEVAWDPGSGSLDAAGLEGVDAVVHLSGENIGARWTPERRRRIRASRVDATALLARALAGLGRPPAVLVQASAIGIYGDRGDEPLTEGSPTGTGFLGELGREWEAASAPAEAAGIRVVRLRFGPVLSAAGGMLPPLLLPFRLGVGGRVGSGRQYMPWVTRADAVGIVLRALDDERLAGPVNAVAGSATNADFTRALGRALRRPAVLAVPAAALLAVYGTMARQTLLSSQNVVPARLRELGHEFLHPTLDVALPAAIADGG
jgi:uncharacterized protein